MIYRIGVVLLTLVLFSCTGKNVKDQPQSLNRVDSLELLDSLIRKSPLESENYALRAKIRFNTGEIDQAINDINLAIQVDSLNCEYRLQAAEYYLSQGKSGKSKDQLEACLDYHPENLDAKLKLAEIHLLVNQYKEAMTLLVECLKEDPQIAHAYYLKGIIYMEMGDTAQAVYNLQEANIKDPEFYQSYMLLGTIKSAQGDSICLDYFRNALDLRPNSIEAYYNIGMYYQNHDNPKKAIETYFDLIEYADSTYEEAYYNIGYVYLQYSENNQKAIEYFTKAIELQPQYFQAYHNRGVCYELMGEYEKAGEDYRRALSILPNYQLSVQGLNRLDNVRKRNNR